MQFQANGSILHGARTVENYGLVVRLIRQEVCSKEPTQACIRAHVDAGLLKFPADVPQDSSPAYAHCTAILAEPVIRAVEQAGRLDIELPILLGIYHRARDVWRGQNIETRVCVPLLNIEGDLDQAIVGEDLLLSKFLPDEKNDLFGRWLNQEFITASAIGRSTYKLSATIMTGQSEIPERIAAQAERIVTAIRLLRTGAVGAPVVFYDRRSCGLGLVPVILETIGVRPYGLQSKLTKGDVPQIQGLFDKLRKINFPEGKSALGAALRRFNLSYSRQSAEDKLIDLAIAWESSLLNDTEDELTYKLSVRGGALLAPVREPSDTASLLQSGYRMRSKIVHNGESISDQSLLPKFEDVTREVLRSYVTSVAGGETLKSINESLERTILTALKRVTAPANPN